MTINRGTSVRKESQNVDAFIGKAPDARRKGVVRGRKEQITLTIAPDLLAKVDAIASRMGQSRAALINRAIYELAERVAA
jgi:Ribbon-helix-helix protein, copG family